MKEKKIILKREVIEYEGLCVEAFSFFPQPGAECVALSLITHGYTSHKGALLNWGQRLAMIGVPTMIFDLPGHYLGSFRELESFDLFSKKCHYLFLVAFEQLKTRMKEFYSLDDIDLRSEKLKLIFGGHSLGALMAIKAMNLSFFRDYAKFGVCVGLGMNKETDRSLHTLEMPFYQDVLELRSQLVSPHLQPQKIFPWLRSEKQKIEARDLSLLFIGGKDDLIAPPEETEKLVNSLRGAGNNIDHVVKERLPHHMPEMAPPHFISHIKNFIAKN